jgi:small-conductance mechanosensitive channel
MTTVKNIPIGEVVATVEIKFPVPTDVDLDKITPMLRQLLEAQLSVLYETPLPPTSITVVRVEAT